MLFCNPHNTYHSVFAKVVNKYAEKKMYLSVYIFPFLYTCIYCEKTDLDCLNIWCGSNEDNLFLYYYEIHYKKKQNQNEH